MDYEERYSLPERDQPLRIAWSAGFGDVDVFFGDRLVARFTQRPAPLDGLLIHDEDLGRIELEFHRKSGTIDVIVGDYHHPENRSHPARRMKRLSMFFFAIGIVYFIEFLYGFFVAAAFKDLSMDLLTARFVSCGLVLAVFLVSGVQVYLSRAWAYYAGYGIFALLVIGELLLTTINLMSLTEIVVLLSRLLLLAVLSFNLNMPYALTRRLNRLKEEREDLLDD